MHGALGAAGNEEVTHEHEASQHQHQGNQPDRHRAEEHGEQNHQQTQNQGSDGGELQVSASTIAEVFQPLSGHQTNQRPGNQPHAHNGRDVGCLSARGGTEQKQTHKDGENSIDQVPAGTCRLQRTEVTHQFKHTTEQHRKGEHKSQNC